MSGPEFEVVCLVESEAGEVTDLPPEAIAHLRALGDSLTMAGGDGLFKIHLHCDDTDAAIAVCEGLGRVIERTVERLLPGMA